MHEPASQRRVTLLHVAAVLIAALAPHVGALEQFFSQDDFAGLARAAGQLPRLEGPWRWLSHQFFWDVMRPIAGLDPLPYHATALATHAAGALLLLVWLRRRLSAEAALLGAAFFAAHPALFTATHWISAIGDPLAVACGAAVLLLAERRDAWRWWALPAFGAALLAKESVVPLPLVVLLASATCPHERDRSGAPTAAAAVPLPRRTWGASLARASRDPLALALVAMAATFAVYLRVFDPMGSSRGGEGTAYAIGLGAHVAENLLSYVGWTVNFAYPTVRGFSDARDPLVYGWAVAALGFALAAMLWAPLRRRGLGSACLAFLAMLLPVLPLRSHTYHYYLGLPLLAAAWAGAILVDGLLGIGRSRALAEASPPRGARATPVTVAVWLVVSLLLLNGVLLARRIETAPLGALGLLADPVIDRARIARQVRDDIALAVPAPGTRLAIWLPDGWAYPGSSPPPTATATAPYTRRNLDGALLGGLAVRVLFPGIREARIVGSHEPLPRDWSWALCRPDGRLRVLGSAALDSLLQRFGEPR